MPLHSRSAAACPYADLSQDFKPFELSDPWTFYERARTEAPVFYSRELDYWVVSRYADIREIFRDPATFSSENTQSPYRARPPEVQKILDDGNLSVVSGLSGRQPPDHTRLRGFIKKAFTPKRVAAQEPRIREIATTMIDAFAQRGQADLAAELAYELPALVIFGMLGVPDSDVPNVKAWAASRVYMNFGDAPVAEQVYHAENLVRYWRYCQDLVAARLEHPQDDLPGDLARIYLEGDQTLTPDEIAGLVYGQLTAGHETTTALLSSGLRELLNQRETWERLCADPELIPGAVEELLRLTSPVFTWKRRTKRAATVAGVEIPADSNVLLLLGSANRDAEQFPEPDRIELGRENASRHLSFGLGIHFCLGSPLARLEGKVVLEELTRRLPGLRLVEGQTFDYSANSSFRGPSHVLVEWDTSEADAGTSPAASGPPATAPLVASFAVCGEDAARVGGKAASLASMAAAELPVPPGFVVTTAAFDAVRAIDGIGGEIAAAIAALDRSRVSVFEQETARIRAVLEQSELPDELDRAIRESYRALGDEVPVAVRSSASMEDSAQTSFAGQQDTYLWIVGEDAVIEHVKRCWASVYSARSLSYRHDHGVDEREVSMAVVVQLMVQARAAGVAMTLDPLTGDRTRIVIEAAFGLGELIASGAVTPDRYVADKVILELTGTEIAAKEIELVADLDAGCAVERQVEPERRSQPALDSESVIAIAKLAKQAERHFGAPQDVEWAQDQDGRIWLLQSRPETVWSSKKPAAPQGAGGYMTGLSSITNTLINPLAARSTSDGDH